MEKQPGHHVRQNICATRKAYREGRRDTAIKVYTVHQESKYLLVQGIPAVGASRELIKLFALYGAIDEYRILDEYPAADQFTEVYWVKFQKIQAARVAKRKMDDFSFFGGVLHVCYAPEYETVEECRQKLLDRRKAVAARIRKLKEEDEEEQEILPDAQSTSNEMETASFAISIKSDSQIVDVSTCRSSNTSHTPTTTNSHAQFQHQIRGENTHDNTNTHDNRNTGGFGHPWGGPHHQNYQGYNHPVPQHPLANPYTTPVWHSQGQRSQFDHARVPSAHATLPLGFNPYPESSALHNNYHNRLVEKSNSERVSENSKEKKSEANVMRNERIVNGVVVRDYDKKVKQAPKFIPRQTVTKKRNVNMDTDGVTVPVKKSKINFVSDGTDVSKNSKEVSVVKRDKLDEELKRNAFVLGPVAGPCGVPPDVKLMKTVKLSEEASIEKTRAEIREKLKKFSAIAIPRQVLKKKSTKDGRKFVQGSGKPAARGKGP
ncbi:uncharacterized protein LOC135500477 [Lineus longissimus]|uniref:uncharacterized protein LOC135500477 n=1 Tax=Lineus longissimus TaxID=88925 RepID=UPI00315CFBE0